VSECSVCGHEWNLHPGGSVWVTICGACIAEEDCGDRDEAEVCSLVPPRDEQRPCGLTLVARYKRRHIQGDRIFLKDGQDYRWAVLRAAGATPDALALFVISISRGRARTRSHQVPFLAPRVARLAQPLSDAIFEIPG